MYTLNYSYNLILGKTSLFKYDMWTDDASSHEPEEVQCGFVPKDEQDADIRFEYDEVLNKTFLTVNAYLWNVYQEDLIRILQRDDGYKIPLIISARFTGLSEYPLSCPSLQLWKHLQNLILRRKRKPPADMLQ